jgi:hypothetical protein
LRAGNARERRQRGGAGGELQEFSAGEVHAVRSLKAHTGSTDRRRHDCRCRRLVGLAAIAAGGSSRAGSCDTIGSIVHRWKRPDAGRRRAGEASCA